MPKNRFPHNPTASYLLLLAICLLMLLSACGLPPERLPDEPPEIAAVPTASETETPRPTVTETSTATATSMPTATATPTHTPSPTPLPACPELNSLAPFAYPADVTMLSSAILDFLNAGGQWDDLFSLLEELEIRHDFIQVDMNGNGLVETAVYTNAYDKTTQYHAWMIFQCTTSQEYQIIYSIEGFYAFHRFFMAEDLNNDHLPELIVVSGFAGSACAFEPRVWSWQIDEIVDFSPSHREVDIGCPRENPIILQDIDGDHLKELILIGETVGHIDYAPPRGITQTFALEDGHYKLTDTIFAPAYLRVHVFDDAQKALDMGDLFLAISYYRQAAYENMPTVGSYNIYLLARDDDAEAYQQAFALFRLAILQLVTGEVEEANLTLTDLNDQYLEEQPGYVFVILTDLFFDVYAEGNLGEACEQVTQYIVEQYTPHKDEATLLHHFYWGGNTASYVAPASFCPIFEIPIPTESYE